MKEVIKVDTIDQYNKLFRLETLHPLVSVVDLSKAPVWPDHFRFNYGVYCIYLKDAKCGTIRYGRQNYDYQEGSIVAFAPGQIANVDMERGDETVGAGCAVPPRLASWNTARQGNRPVFFLLIRC